jgi:hypothetical protein
MEEATAPTEENATYEAIRISYTSRKVCSAFLECKVLERETCFPIFFSMLETISLIFKCAFQIFKISIFPLSYLDVVDVVAQKHDDDRVIIFPPYSPFADFPTGLLVNVDI